MSQVRISLLLGGFFPGPDGWVTSTGMLGLRSQIAARFPAAVIQTYQWSSYRLAGDDIAGHQEPDTLTICIGYSGGGSRLTWMANEYRSRRIDLMILYDPSPAWQMKSIDKTGVVRALCYHNTRPFFMGLGGGVLLGHQVTSENIAMNHAAVQFSQDLHDRTLQEIAKLIGT